MMNQSSNIWVNERSTLRANRLSDHYISQWEAQSDMDDTVNEDIQQIVSFVDENPGTTTGFVSGNHVFSLGDKTSDTSIEEFFRRPVRIDSYTWLESDTMGIKRDIYPWHLWANEATVKNKLNNYSFFRGDLHVKIVISASPFYYGLTKVSYLPMQAFTPSTITLDAANRWFISNSQRPHTDIEPKQQEGSTLVLPFLHQKNWVNIQLASEMQGMGELFYIIYSVLQSANGAVGTGVTVTTYAWVENVQLSGASIGYSMQSDEYNEGIVSRPASNIAKAASYFENIPIIGQFATATRIGASAVSAIASMFGFTNVPVIANTAPYRPEPFPKMASSEISYPVEKLTLDPKNELSIDPRVCGWDCGIDEMQISYLAQKRSYLTKANWTTSNATDDMLFYSRVNPRLYDSDGATQAKVYMTPACWVSNAFDSWRGTVIFTFKFVTSKYMKGRVRISYDPTGYAALNIGNTSTSSNVVHTAIVDIGETDEVEFEIPYQQATQFLYIRPSLANADEGWGVNGTPGSFLYDGAYDNGLITVRVLNVLTAPIASANIDMYVYVRMGKDFELANPANIDNTHKLSYFAPQSLEEDDVLAMSRRITQLSKSTQSELLHYSMYHFLTSNQLRELFRHYLETERYQKQQIPSDNLWKSYFEPQSDEFHEDGKAASVYIGTNNNPSNDQYLVHFGENIRSLRQLLRRYEYHSSNYFDIPTNAYTAFHILRKFYYRYPTIPGFVTGGTETAVKLVGVGNTAYNFCQFTFLSYFMPGYIGYRGSVNWSFNVNTSTYPISEARAYRDNVPASVYPGYSTTTSAESVNVDARTNMLFRQSGGTGQAIINGNTTAGLNVQCPNYTIFKFQTTNPAIANNGSALDGSLYDQEVLEMTVKTNALEAARPVLLNNFVGAGTDFSLFFFVNVPTMFVYSAVPTAA